MRNIINDLDNLGYYGRGQANDSKGRNEPGDKPGETTRKFEI